MQAGTIGTLVAFVLPFIAGIRITVFPHMHAAEGCRPVMTDEGSIETVLVRVVALLVFASAFFLVGVRRLRSA